MEQVINKEKHQQQVELLKQQNRISEERITYLKDMERKLKQILIEWKKEEDKNKVIKQMQALLFRKDEQRAGSPRCRRTCGCVPAPRSPARAARGAFRTRTSGARTPPCRRCG